MSSGVKMYGREGFGAGASPYVEVIGPGLPPAYKKARDAHTVTSNLPFPPSRVPPPVIRLAKSSMPSSRTTLVALAAATLTQAAYQIQSMNSAFSNSNKQGCISATSNISGSTVVIYDCNAEDASRHTWDFDPSFENPQQIRIFGDKCLDVKGGRNADGSRLYIRDCLPSYTEQMFVFRALTSSNELDGESYAFQWAGTDKCVDLTDGSTENGNQLGVWTCDEVDGNQAWGVVEA
ncbi:hypothetical protein V5O48_013055 [Marasmius crinis-equi]|uniref:Ricin B lectin domain-containing protein n=1 Tax=Marasmius crinis-equi TaxID=585013 RepID=A0ABR3F198_9AGAR